MTETELHQAVQQWQNGDKPACWHVSEWFRQRQSPAAVRFVYELLDPHVEDDDRMQQAKDIASDAFWAAMEELDLKVSGGKLLLTPIGRQRLVKNEKRDLFLGLVSGRELSAREPLQWRGLESFAALLWRIWLLRCQDGLRKTIPRGEHVRIGSTPTCAEGERTGIAEEEVKGDAPDGEMVALSKENLQAFLAALQQFTQQLYQKKQPSLADIGEALLRYAREQLRALSVDARAPVTQAADAWEFVQDSLKLDQDVAYQRKSRFLKAVKASPQASVLLEHSQKPKRSKG